MARGICEQISGVTVWRWLSEDAIKPWQYRSWIFPRDPPSPPTPAASSTCTPAAGKASFCIPATNVVCCDEKLSIQAGCRTHPTLPAAVTITRGQRVEHEYERRGALCYFAAWDAKRAKLFDRCDDKDGIVPFDALVEQFMTVEPYRNAQRVFVIVDNGSAHRGQASIRRLQGRYENRILVHTSVHASWLNQAEIYFSIVQRKVLTPNDFPDRDTLEQQLLAFGRRYEQIATPFEWKSPAPTSTASPNESSYPPLTQPDRIPRRASESEHLAYGVQGISQSGPGRLAAWRVRCLPGEDATHRGA